MRTIRILPALLSVLLLIPGCPGDDSGSGDDDSSSTPTPTDAATDTPATPTPSPDPTPDACESTDVSSIIGGVNHLGSTAAASDAYTGSCGSAGTPEEILSFVAPDDGSYIVSTANPGSDYDTLIYAFTNCLDPLGSELSCNDDSGSLQSQITVNALAGQRIFIAVDGFSGAGNYELSITTLICGDGLIAPGLEQCDDGNTVAGDGCDSSCLFECTDDLAEDDDSEATANLVTNVLPSVQAGVLCPSDVSIDYNFAVDFYSVDLAPGEVLDGTVGPGATTDCTQQSLIFQAFTPGLVELLGEGISNGADCPSWTGAVDPNGGATVIVAIYATAVGGPPQDYTFTLDSRTAVCGDNVVDGNEECDDGNTVGGDACEADCSFPPLCQIPVDSALGALASGAPTAASVDLTVRTNSLPDISCTVGGGADYIYSMTVAGSGNLVVDVDHTGGDVQYALYADDGSCTELSCNDFFPDPSGQIVAAVTPGDYRLVIEAFQPGTESNVNLVITAP